MDQSRESAAAPRRLVILGSTGSIGRQALEVLAAIPGCDLVGLAAGSSVGLLALAMMFLSRSSLVIVPSLQGSKYALLVLLQLLLLVVVWQTEEGAAEPAHAADVAVNTDGREEAVQ